MLAYYVMPIFSKERVNASLLYLGIACPHNLHCLAIGDIATFDCI